MTEDQNKKYWRRWGVVCRVNHWIWVNGRVVESAVRDAGRHHAEVWRIAGQIADQDCRMVEANDLRHACHVHALRREMSHSKFTNDQFTRLLLLWGNERQDSQKIVGLLVDPFDVAAQKFWDHAELQKKESLVRSIRAAACDEYICPITEKIWGTIYWEDLNCDELVGLLRKLKGNAPALPGNPF